MSASYQTEEAARHATEHTTVPTVPMTEIGQERAAPQSPPRYGPTMPSTAAARIIPIDAHPEARGALTLEGGMAQDAERLERASTQPRLAGALPEEYLIFLFPMALFVVFAMFALIIAWS
jgi:hypothetical protein